MGGTGGGFLFVVRIPVRDLSEGLLFTLRKTEVLTPRVFSLCMCVGIQIHLFPQICVYCIFIYT